MTGSVRSIQPEDHRYSPFDGQIQSQIIINPVTFGQEINEGDFGGMFYEDPGRYSSATSRLHKDLDPTHHKQDDGPDLAQPINCRWITMLLPTLEMFATSHCERQEAEFWCLHVIKCHLTLH